MPNVVADITERLLDDLEELPICCVLHATDVSEERYLQVEFVDPVSELLEEVVALVESIGTYDFGESPIRRTASDEVDWVHI